MGDQLAIAAAAGLTGGVVFFVLAVVFALWVLLVVAHWKMFTKAGEAGWKSIIPIYSDYTLFKIVWNTKSFWMYVGLTLLTAIITSVSGDYTMVDGQIVVVGGGNFFVGLLSNIVSFLLLAFTVILNIKTALSYGNGVVFALGLILLPNVFTLILGFGSARYQGPQG